MKNSKLYAIKLYPKQKLLLADKTAAVQSELQILQGLDHPNVVRLVEFFENPRHFVLVMEFAGHSNLSAYIQKHINPTFEVQIGILKQLLVGLSYLHGQMIVHGDIKLENILLDSHNHLTLVDFSLSRRVPSPDYLFLVRPFSLQAKSGTPIYLSPETVHKIPNSGLSADIWAFGVTAFRLLCGYFPFEGKPAYQLAHSYEALIAKIKQASPIYPQHLSSQVLEWLSSTLTPDPAQRPSAQTLLDTIPLC